MNNQQAVLQGFHQLITQMLYEEQQKPPLLPNKVLNNHRTFNANDFGFSFYLKPRLSELIQWVQQSREISNFTYDLNELNLGQLAGWVSAISGCSIKKSAAVDG